MTLIPTDVEVRSKNIRKIIALNLEIFNFHFLSQQKSLSEPLKFNTLKSLSKDNFSKKNIRIVEKQLTSQIRLKVKL